MGGSLTHFMPSRLHEIKVLAPIAVQAQGLAAFRLAAVAAYPEEREKRPGNIQPCGLAASRTLLPFFRLHGIKVLAPIAVQAQGLAAFRLAAVAAYPEEREKRPGNIQPCGLAASRPLLPFFRLHGS